MGVNAKNNGYFFNSNSGDRKYSAESMEEWLKPFFLSGVFQGDLQVTAQSVPAMSVAVSGGFANLDGKLALWESSNNISISTASGSYDRIDTIVLRRDNVNRTILIDVVTGTASANPQPTAPVRDSETYELVIAQIRVRSGSTAVENRDITDTRLNPAICGYVATAVDQIDFDQIKNQFDDWFEHVKGQLDDDAAGHLQNEIDALALRLTAVEAITENALTRNDVVNDFESGGTNVPLSAEMGKTLYETKLAKNAVYDGLDSDLPTMALSAAKGKALYQTKVDVSSIVNSLSSDATNAPLSAKQGKVLNTNKVDKSSVAIVVGTASVYSGRMAAAATVYRTGNTGFIVCHTNCSHNQNSWQQIFSIPDGFRPYTNIYAPAVLDEATLKLIRILPGGEVAMYKTESGAVDFTISYPINAIQGV